MPADSFRTLGGELPPAIMPRLVEAEAYIDQAHEFLINGQELEFVVVYHRPGQKSEYTRAAWASEEEKHQQAQAAREKARTTGCDALFVIADCFYLPATRERLENDERPNQSPDRREQLVVDVYTPTANACWEWRYERRPEKPRVQDRVLMGAKRCMSSAKGGSLWDPWPPRSDA